jgi:hypothetical protein
MGFISKKTEKKFDFGWDNELWLYPYAHQANMTQNVRMTDELEMIWKETTIV